MYPKSARNKFGEYFFRESKLGIPIGAEEVSAQEHLEHLAKQPTDTGLLARWILNKTREGGTLD